MLGPLNQHNFIKNKQKQSFASVFVSFFLFLACCFTPSSAMAEEASKPVAAASTVAPETPKALETPKKAPKNAPEQSAAAAVDVKKTVNTIIIAEIDSTITVTLDGETLESTEVRRTENGGLYVNAMPIFSSLENDVEYDDVSKALIVRRSQDGVVMELFTDTGIVKADGRALGRLKHFGEVSEDRFLLTPNAIAVLSGAAGKFNAKTNEFNFKLDPRLKVATGFEVFVNDVSLRNLNPAPRSVGPVLLLPLLPIAEELGHDVRILSGGNIIRVRRAQDSAEFEMNLDTGLIKLRGKPIGLSKDIAYIDPINLLLPVSAIETLTGTNVVAEGGSNRIDVNLDERLSGSIKPSQSVDEATKSAKFTPESLSFHLGPDSVNTVELNAHGGRFNGRLRYETPDIATNVAELEPSWLSVDFAHTKGAVGSLGDYSADLRELDGVGIRRIRGGAIRKETDKGRWALAAGAPALGGREISSDQSRLTYGGLAVGARYADRDGWEGGAALKLDGLTDDQMVVLSAISGRLGRVKDKRFQWDASADAGYFNGSARESSLDVRANLNGRFDVNDTLTADAFVQYEGAEFLRTDLDVEDTQDAITEALNSETLDEEEEEEAFIPDTRERGMDQLTIGGSLRLAPSRDIGILNNPAAALSVQQSRTGAFKNSDLGATITTKGLNVATGINNTGISLSGSATQFNVNYHDERESESGRQYTAQAFKRFEHATVRLRYQNDKRSGDASASNTLSANISTKSYNVPLPKESGLTISPSVSGILTDTDSRINGGVITNFTSGNIFGPKNQVNASFGIIQSISGRNGSQNDRFLTLTAARRLRLGSNMALGLSYRNNLRGNQRIGLTLDGHFDFNEKRKFKSTKDGRGVLKGQAFFDKNRNKIRDEDEEAIPGAIVRLKGTRLSLRTDNVGQFTIQNVKEGIYEVLVDGQSLPLGFDLSDAVSTKVTIQEGFITDVPLPIVQRGQIRGFTYIDENNDGQYNKGEERVEGATLQLSAKEADLDEMKTYSASFGQFAFDDLPAGEYVVSSVTNAKAKIIAGAPVTVDLEPDLDLMGRIAVAVKRGLEIEPNDIEVVLEAEAPENEPTDKPVRRGYVVIEDIDTPSDVPKGLPPPNIITKELASTGPAPP